MSSIVPMEPITFTIFKQKITRWHKRNMYRLRNWHNNNMYKYRQWKRKMAQKCICGSENVQSY